MLDIGTTSGKQGSPGPRFPRIADSLMESVRALKIKSERNADPLLSLGLNNGYLQYVENGLQIALEAEIEERDCGTHLIDLEPLSLHIPALPEKCLTLTYNPSRMRQCKTHLLKPSLPFVALCREEMAQFSEGAGFTVTIISEVDSGIWRIPKFLYFFPYNELVKRHGNRVTLNAFPVEGLNSRKASITDSLSPEDPGRDLRQNMDKLLLVLRALTRVYATQACAHFPAVYLP